MEAPFTLFLIGLALWGMKVLLARKRSPVPWYAFVLTGLASGVLLGLVIGNSLMPPLCIPWYLLSIMGGISGIFLYLADRYAWFFKPGIEYIITLLLGGGLGILFYALFNIYLRVSHLTVFIQSYNTTLWFSMILMGFVIVLGYSFPERFQKNRKTSTH